MSDRLSSEASIFLSHLRNGIWLLGISFWLFGIIDRSIASFSDGSLSSVDTLQLFTAAFFFIAWLFLKPKSGSREKPKVGNSNSPSASPTPPAIF
jgi:hypothetical protein